MFSTMESILITLIFVSSLTHTIGYETKTKINDYKDLIESYNTCGIGKKTLTMATNDWKAAKTLYQFSAKDIDGNEISLDKYKGRPTLVVNVASKCGLTQSNYKQLNELFAKYEANGLRIVAFPSNEFRQQEPGCETDIKEFARKRQVKFDMMAKIEVNGDNAHPLYKWLKSQESLGVEPIEWNFAKFLVDKNGLPVKRYHPTVEPKDIEHDLKSRL